MVGPGLGWLAVGEGEWGRGESNLNYVFEHSMRGRPIFYRGLMACDGSHGEIKMLAKWGMRLVDGGGCGVRVAVGLGQRVNSRPRPGPIMASSLSSLFCSALVVKSPP